MTTTPYLSEILQIILGNINHFSEVAWDESKITISNVSHLTDTPGDDLLFMVKLIPEEIYGLVDHYMTTEDICPIDIEGIQETLRNQLGDIPHRLFIETPIGIGYSLLLPILLLK